MDDNQQEILRRLFEPMPQDWESMFQVGDHVELARPYTLWAEIPLGAVGIIRGIGESEVMLEKGRPFLVEFDLTAYRIPLSEAIRRAIAKMGEEPPEFHGNMTVDLGPRDIRKAAAWH